MKFTGTHSTYIGIGAHCFDNPKDINAFSTNSQRRKLIIFEKIKPPAFFFVAFTLKVKEVVSI